MNILTVGDSPFLITRDARINRDICTYFKSQSHKVDSAALNHDILFFLPDERRESYYEGVRLFPVDAQKGGTSLQIYETMKKSQPQMVISIGHYSHVDLIHSIKALYPHLFKWVAIITSGSAEINEKYKDKLNLADTVIALNQGTRRGLEKILAKPVQYIHYGAGTDFVDQGKEKDGILFSGKNSQISNISAFIRAVSDYRGAVHFNADDTGFYDVPLLMRRYGIEGSFSLPDKFVSVREGISDQLMNELYNQHAIFVDCSMQSTTSISMLEAMKTGCIPVAVDTGASKDILSLLPFDFRFLIEGETYVGEKEETFTMVSHSHLKVTLEAVIKKLQNKEWATEARNTIKCLSESFSKDKFLCKINQILQDTMLCQNTLVVDSF